MGRNQFLALAAVCIFAPVALSNCGTSAEIQPVMQEIMPLKHPRAAFRMLLYMGGAFAISGRTLDFHHTDACAMYNDVRNQWIPLPACPVASENNMGGGAVVLSDGNIVNVGTGYILVFKAPGVWGQIPLGRSGNNAQVVVLPNGKILIAGGEEGTTATGRSEIAAVS